MDSRTLGEHTVQRYDQELESLRAKVLRIGGLVESQLEEALLALREQDAERASEVVGADSRINELEREIDEDCNGLIARRAPVAADLRLVMGAVKAVNDLERMGDEAVRIARMASRLGSRTGSKREVSELRHFGPQVQEMLRRALDAFARTDPQAAAIVMEADRQVDREYESLSREMITFMMEDPRAIPWAMDLMFAVRALERIADRACNICEYVIYIVKGADVRHTSPEQVRNVVGAED